MEEHIDYFDILLNLEPGTEVNVYTDRKKLYNATFRKLNTKERVAHFVIDQFYEHGNYLIPIACDEIYAMDLPMNRRDVSEEDE